MTEQEIVNILKENKNEGRMLSFMPEEVQKWCEEHKKELLVWQSNSWYEFDADDICTDDAVTLPDDYKVKKEPKGIWIEFEIDDEGDFAFYLSKIRKKDFHWYEWQRFLFECYENNHQCFTAFGGWQYKNCKAWYTYPMILLGDDRYASSVFKEEASDAKPAIPVKIRFWREIK